MGGGGGGERRGVVRGVGARFSQMQPFIATYQLLVISKSHPCYDNKTEPYLQHDLCLLCCLVVGCPDTQVFLVLLAIHPLVDGATRQAVLMTTHWTAEEVDQVLVETPAMAVRCLAVVAIASLALRRVQAAAQVPLVHLI